MSRARAALDRLGRWLQAGALPDRPGGASPPSAAASADAVVLTAPGAVAWATGGATPPVDRTAAVDLLWAVVTPEGASLITTVVEADRVAEECQPAAHGFHDLVAVPWHDPGAYVRAAEDLAGAPAERLAGDGHPAFGVDVGDDLTALRLALSGPEVDDLRELAADAASALEGALSAWRPGERDLDIQARVAAALEERGADAPVLIVGGDDRVRRHRHPLAVGAQVRHLAMAVVVARRGGLHAAATRFACAGKLPGGLRALRQKVLRAEQAVLAASRPGASYGQALAALDAAYAAAGAPGAWTGHYQGGPIGFRQREFEIAPGQTGSRWHSTPIAAGHALAWNPSLPGGAKAEDTYLCHGAGLERLTCGTTGWPADAGDHGLPPRPEVLELR